MKFLYGIIAVIIIVGIILVLYYYTTEMFDDFSKVKKHIPKEALNCPHMKSQGIDLGDKEYMKKNWKTVVSVVESGLMPPAGYENIWTPKEKNAFILAVKTWGNSL